MPKYFTAIAMLIMGAEAIKVQQGRGQHSQGGQSANAIAAGNIKVD